MPDLSRPVARKSNVIVAGALFLGLLSGIFSARAALARQENDDLPSVGVSEAPSIRMENMGMADGLAQGSVYQIMQDSHGFIWFGTQGGLHRYDGQSFEVYSPVAFDTTSITDGWVWGVNESRDGSIWASTTAGLDRLDPMTGQFQHFVHDPADPATITAGTIWDTVEARDGTIWVATNNGVDRMDADRKGVFKHYAPDPNDPNSLSATQTYFVSEDAEGQIWASTMDGLNRIDPATDKITRYFNVGSGTGNWGEKQAMLQVLFDTTEEGVLWVGTGWGLIRLNYLTGTYDRIVPYPDEPEGSSRNSVLSIARDPTDSGVFWLGLIGGGLARFNRQQRDFTFYRNNPGDPNSLASDAAGSIFTDRSGEVWVGYSAGAGIGKFNPGSVKMTQISYDPDEPRESVMTEGFPWAIFEDSQERLWVGSVDLANTNHLTRYNLKTGDLSRFESDPQNTHSILPGTIASIIEDAAGSIWIGSRGVARCNPVSMRCRQFVPSRTDSTKLPVRNAQALFESPREPGIVWVGMSGGSGLNRLDSRTGIVTRYTNDLQDPTSGPRGVADIMEDAAGVMWLGTFDLGLVRFDRTTETFTRYSYNPADTSTVASVKYESVHERSSEPGILWLGGESGLERFDVASGKVTHFTTANGLANNNVYGILEDASGLLWMSTNRGISSFDPETGTFKNYGLDDGLAALEGMQNGFAKGSGDVMYFGNVSGISAFVPAQLTTNSNPPPVSLTTLRINGRHVDPGPENVLKQPLEYTQSITLSFSENDFSVDFVALHFANPTKNTYSYRLEGYEDEWSEPGFTRSASFTNIGPGSYTFHVRAANPDGVWNEEGAALEVVVLPPWWRTGWAIAFFVVLLGGLVFAFDRVQRIRLTKKERARAEIQEAELRVETAEAQALALKADNERKENIERLSEIGKEITSSLDFETIFGKLYEHINQLTDAPVFGVGIYHEDEKEIEYRLAIENGKRYEPYSRDASDKNQFPVWCIEHREAVFINDVANEYSRYIESYDEAETILEDGTLSSKPKSLIYLPLATHDRVIGIITVQSFETNAYTENDLNLLKTMAAYASVALDNATAYRKLDGTISELKRTQQQLVQQEKMASLGQLTAGVAHEIKNPLNFVNNFADVNTELATELRELVSTKPDLQVAEVRAEIDDLIAGLQLNARQISKHGRRADAIVQGMMQHTHQTGSERFPVAVNAFVDEYVNLAWHGKRATDENFDIKVRREYADDLGNANISPQEMGRVLVNLVNNAFDAVCEVEESEVVVSTRRRGKRVEILVSDNGPGVPEELREKIFEPFFTTKPSGEGTGLGLSLSHDIVTQGHDGTMRVEKSSTGGAAFVISLPLEKNGS